MRNRKRTAWNKGLCRLQNPIPCPFCEATGRDPNSILSERPCPVCKGVGKNRWICDYSKPENAEFFYNRVKV